MMRHERAYRDCSLFEVGSWLNQYVSVRRRSCRLRKTSLVGIIYAELLSRLSKLLITNDIYTLEDAEYLARAGALPPGAHPAWKQWLPAPGVIRAKMHQAEPGSH